MEGARRTAFAYSPYLNAVKSNCTLFGIAQQNSVFNGSMWFTFLHKWTRCTRNEVLSKLKTHNYPVSCPLHSACMSPQVSLVSTTCCINVPWICLSACPSIHDSHIVSLCFHQGRVFARDKELGYWAKLRTRETALCFYIILHLPYLPFCHSASVHVPIRLFTYHLASSQHSISILCSPFRAVPRPHVAHIHDDACMNWWVYHDLPHQSTSCEVEIALKIKRVAVLDKQFTEYKLAGSEAKRIPAQRLDSRPSKWDLRTTLAANPALSAPRLHLPPWKYRAAWRKRLFSLSEFIELASNPGVAKTDFSTYMWIWKAVPLVSPISRQGPFELTQIV